MKREHSSQKYRMIAAALALTFTTGWGTFPAAQASADLSLPPSFLQNGKLPAPPNEQLPPGPPPNGQGMPAPGMEQKDASELTAQQIVDNESKVFDGLTLNSSATDEVLFWLAMVQS